MALGLPSDFRFDIFARDRSGPAWRGVETSVQRTQRAAATLMSTLGPLLGVGGAGLAANQLGHMSRQSLEFADALVQAADRTSFTVDELERLRYAGRLNRVEFNQTDMAMQRFSRRVAEAANGSGELRADLEQLNIPLRDANGNMRSSYEILMDYADAIKNAEDRQERLRLAFKAFDSEGAALVTMLQRGSDGFREFVARGEEAEAFMGEQLARSASEAAVAMRDMEMALGAEFNTAVAENADGLVELSEALADVAGWGIRAAAAMGRFIGSVRSWSDEVSPQEQALRDNRIDHYAAQQDLRRAQARLDNPGTWDFRRDAIREEIAALEGQIQLLDEQYDRMLQRQHQEEIGREAGTRPPIRTDQNETEEIAHWEDIASVLPRYGPRSRPEAEAGIAALHDMASRKATEYANEQVKAQLDEMEQNRDAFAEEFAWSFSNGLRAAFDGNLQEFLAQRLREAAYNGLYDAAVEVGRILFDTIQTAKGDGTGGGFFAAAGSAVATAFGFGGNKADGGTAWGGMAVRVGERGPEWLVPSVDSTILKSDGSFGAPQIVERLVVVAVDKSDMFDTVVDERAAAAVDRAAPGISADAQTQTFEKLAKQKMRVRR